jgi:hypothetical protein
VDHAGWFNRVSDFEKSYCVKHNVRVTAVRFPAPVPEVYWNVPSAEFRGHSRINNENVPNIRSGILSTYRIELGDKLEAVLSDGSEHPL